MVRYQYNSWGKVTSTQDTSGVSLATLNPFRYRKYVYDPETGLYCLGSRYYDPEVGRFVNADDTDVIFAKPQELSALLLELQLVDFPMCLLVEVKLMVLNWQSHAW